MSEDTDNLQDNVYEVAGGTVTLKDRFRSTHLPRFKEQAPELAETFLDFFKSQVDYDDEDLEKMNDEEVEAYLEEKEDEQLQQSYQKMLQGSMQLTMEVSIDELEALHELCVNLIDRVDDIDDEDGDPYVWKNMDHEERLTFVDLNVPSHTKMLFFIHAYMEQIGLYDEMAGEDLEEDKDEIKDELQDDDG